MTTGRINLLPPERIHVLSHDYVLRVAVVLVSLCTVLVVVSAVLLVPTHVFLTGSLETKGAQLVAIESTLPSSDDDALSVRLASLSRAATTIAELKSVLSTSVVMREILAVNRVGVKISNIAYTPRTGAKAGVVTVSGTASARNALRNYQTALEEIPIVHSAALPVSAYAKDTDATFTITLTLVP